MIAVVSFILFCFLRSIKLFGIPFRWVLSRTFFLILGLLLDSESESQMLS
jgi:hypothetical protein